MLNYFCHYHALYIWLKLNVMQNFHTYQQNGDLIYPPLLKLIYFWNAPHHQASTAVEVETHFLRGWLFTARKHFRNKPPSNKACCTSHHTSIARLMGCLNGFGRLPCSQQEAFLMFHFLVFYTGICAKRRRRRTGFIYPYYCVMQLHLKCIAIVNTLCGPYLILL